MPTIRKAVIPAAGLGTRLFPLTRALPKEMLPVGGQPVIEHTIRELVASGIEEITVVISGNKGLIQEHFAPDDQLVEQLRSVGKSDLADAVSDLSELGARLNFVYQRGPYGNGTPILTAASWSAGSTEPFLALWADDVFVSERPRAQQLIEAHEATGAPVIALMPMRREESIRYGVPIVESALGDGRLRIRGLVEKPKPEDAPSLYAAIGGYIITPEIVDELAERTRRWQELRDGEIYLTDALHAHAVKHTLVGQLLEGTWYDTGNHLSYLKAQFAAALADPAYGPELRRLVHDLDPAGQDESNT
ncbi:UTP--glucose-1-phosphate uridylyltransferase [Streptomyces sp. NPDC055992]|uniref:UTP--glucose-1-phosphate uridylyltransferase n=1 Tax=Streptomyces sp. NPDC055992 TaxID=3345673 RepID=UPI0035DF0396